MGEELWKKWWKEMREEMDGYAALTIPTHPYVSCRRWNFFFTAKPMSIRDTEVWYAAC